MHAKILFSLLVAITGNRNITISPSTTISVRVNLCLCNTITTGETTHRRDPARLRNTISSNTSRLHNTMPMRNTTHLCNTTCCGILPTCLHDAICLRDLSHQCDIRGFHLEPPPLLQSFLLGGHFNLLSFI